MSVEYYNKSGPTTGLASIINTILYYIVQEYQLFILWTRSTTIPLAYGFHLAGFRPNCTESHGPLPRVFVVANHLEYYLY